jgi:hypothetical protein
MTENFWGGPGIKKIVTGTILSVLSGVLALVALLDYIDGLTIGPNWMHSSNVTQGLLCWTWVGIYFWGVGRCINGVREASFPIPLYMRLKLVWAEIRCRCGRPRRSAE